MPLAGKTNVELPVLTAYQVMDPSQTYTTNVQCAFCLTSFGSHICHYDTTSSPLAQWHYTYMCNIMWPFTTGQSNV